MSWPEWKLVAQLGDADPISYGGYFIYEDATGVYAPEGEILISPDDDDAPEGWQVYRFSLDRCTFIDGVLSDNPHHPGHAAWFADDINSVASSIGKDIDNMVADLCSEDTVRRAWARRAIGDYHGLENLDSDPITFHDRHEIEERYTEHTGYTPSQYEVIVGNIGSVYCGPSRKIAEREFAEYVEISKTGNSHRASGEDVTMLCDGEIEDEFIGSIAMAQYDNSN